MTSLKLDLNNNLVFASDFILVSDLEAISQDVKTRVLMFQTEYPFNIDLGLPWYDLCISNNINDLQNAIIDRVLEDDRLSSVENIEFLNENGKFKLKMDIITKSGEVINV